MDTKQLETVLKDFVASINEASLRNATEAMVNASEKEALKQRRSELDSREESLVASQKKVESLNLASDIKVQNEKRTAELDDRELAVKKEEVRLKKYENDLVEIKNRLDAQDEDLRKREMDLSVREKGYEENIREKFAKNIASSLLLNK